MSRSCKHGIHHDLALPARVIRIENLCCRVSQEPRRGTRKKRKGLYGYKQNHPSIHPYIHSKPRKRLNFITKLKATILLLIKHSIHNSQKNFLILSFTRHSRQPTVAPQLIFVLEEFNPSRPLNASQKTPRGN